jgi:predicted transcriptional regulator
MTPAEFTLMKVLWRLKRGSVADVRAAHAEQYGADLAYTTVMTLLTRLAAKGALKVDKTRQPYLYRPAFPRESVIRQRLQQFVDTVFDGEAGSLVQHLVEDESLSIDDLRRIERQVKGGDDDEEGGE